MTYNLIVSKEAHEDIDAIVHYIANELANPTAAVTLLNDVEKSYHAVVENPSMYSLCHDARLSSKGYRKIVVKNYLILYRVDDEAKTV
ncbi:type II toxin-antitoxin system RelE/ParE family toxin [Dethiobacter alkaliphilus]|uniref:Plasmid stabilization system n=1 Tax=Dethiobacter alkaliphilus AHT 1 TaxID=555088 RepID=C0GC60_DETAL|nr:type II toxin-antitoxin system RelE/ParE family toxin [Dethiobacter alkaliphilus]EEG78795.1 plasmid stabilization system [Dethiobacter alkaliphilus AHT 1]